ncbi:hypothetical protein Goari_011300 [Gossypium aridum]|uniref:Uncharacterized protein n=1 Tax=Gossypium aridum TaxID=34290 RepID=A0A7J8WYA5_GOSAI|nr:hypothetical protein [Gossypium aridum]
MVDLIKSPSSNTRPPSLPLPDTMCSLLEAIKPTPRSLSFQDIFRDSSKSIAISTTTPSGPSLNLTFLVFRSSEDQVPSQPSSLRTFAILETLEFYALLQQVNFE